MKINHLQRRAASMLAALLVLLLALVSPAVSEADQTPGIYIIYDSSNSMWGELADGSRKYEVARDVLRRFLRDDFTDRVLAFRAYGHRRADDCRDSELIAPFSTPADTAARVDDVAQSLVPKGKTPIDWSLRQALEDFGDRSGDIILISDGIESCDADPCALARAWAESDVGISIHVVGLGLDDKARAAMTCIAEASGATYRDAGSADELLEGLRDINSITADAVFTIDGRFENGRSVYVHADMTAPDGTVTTDIGSDRRIVTVPGRHRFRIGVKTRGGSLYKPVETTATAVTGRRTVVAATVLEPPRVLVEFRMEGAEHPGANITAYQEGRRVFSFRPKDAPYVDEGTYEFRTKVDDQSLTLTERFAAGDTKTLVFDLEARVLAMVRFVGSTGDPLPHNFDLFRGGEKVAFGHSGNGVKAAPGVYELRLRNELTPFVLEEFRMPTEKRSEIEIVIPTGRLDVVYRHPDDTESPGGGYRIGRLDESGRERGARVYDSTSRRAFMPGRYRVRPRFSDDPPQDIEIIEGETIRLVFNART